MSNYIGLAIITFAAGGVAGVVLVFRLIINRVTVVEKKIDNLTRNNLE